MAVPKRVFIRSPYGVPAKRGWLRAQCFWLKSQLNPHLDKHQWVEFSAPDTPFSRSCEAEINSFGDLKLHSAFCRLTFDRKLVPETVALQSSASFLKAPRFDPLNGLSAAESDV